MGYSRENYTGYGIRIAEDEFPVASELRSYEYEENDGDIQYAMIMYIRDRFPLLSFQVSGDTRDAEMQFVIVVDSSLELVDETYSSYDDDDLYPEELDEGDANNIDVVAIEQLKAFMVQQNITRDLSWLAWSYVV